MQSYSARPSTGVSTIISFRGSPSFAGSDVCSAGVLAKYDYRTSYRFKTAERAPATDLRGVNASHDSFNTSTTSPAEAYRVDFQSGLFSYAAVGSTI